MFVYPYQKVEYLLNNNNAIWMGILNLTPDSFSDGAKFNTLDKALIRVEELVKYGVNIIDIGGISTRPGSENIGENEEWDRVKNVLINIRKYYPSLIISFDTFYPQNAFKAANLGLIDIINDVTAASIENENITTIDVAAKFNLAIILMHMQNTPKNMQINPLYENCVLEVKKFLFQKANEAKQKKVKLIILDPGIGFGKLTSHNMELLSVTGINNILSLNYPVLIGLSRKKFISEIFAHEKKFDLSVPQNRDFYSKQLELQCINLGVNIIRTHIMPKELNNVEL